MIGVSLCGVIHAMHAFLPPDQDQPRRRTHRQHLIDVRSHRHAGTGARTSPRSSVPSASPKSWQPNWPRTAERSEPPSCARDRCGATSSPACAACTRESAEGCSMTARWPPCAGWNRSSVDALSTMASEPMTSTSSLTPNCGPWSNRVWSGPGLPSPRPHPRTTETPTRGAPPPPRAPTSPSIGAPWGVSDQRSPAQRRR